MSSSSKAESGLSLTPKYGDIALCLDCRTCVERRSMAGTVTGVTNDMKVQVVCKEHGPVATFAMDGSDLGFVAEILKGGCESCRTGKEQRH